MQKIMNKLMHSDLFLLFLFLCVANYVIDLVIFLGRAFMISYAILRISGL